MLFSLISDFLITVTWPVWFQSEAGAHSGSRSRDGNSKCHLKIMDIKKITITDSEYKNLKIVVEGRGVGIQCHLRKNGNNLFSAELWNMKLSGIMKNEIVLRWMKKYREKLIHCARLWPLVPVLVTFSSLPSSLVKFVIILIFKFDFGFKFYWWLSQACQVLRCFFSYFNLSFLDFGFNLFWWLFLACQAFLDFFHQHYHHQVSMPTFN